MRLGLLSFFAVLLMAPPRGTGQAGGVNQAGPTYIHGQVTNDPMPQHGGEGSSQIEQMRKAAMRRQLAADAAKLMQISADLKSAIDTTPADQLSVAALRKAAEAEKLAHSIRDELKY